MPLFNMIQQIEIKTVQEFVKSEPFIVRPKCEHNEIVLVLYFEDAYKDLIEIGRVNKPIEFFAVENIGNQAIEEWIEANPDLVIPSGIFKNT